MCMNEDMQGCAIVTWDSKCIPNHCWDSQEESPIQGHFIPSYVGDVLSRRIAVLDMKADNET